MKYLLLMLFLLSTALTGFSQLDVKAEELRDHVGDTIRFCGKVFSARYMDRLEKHPSFINIGGAYPDQVLTIVVWGRDRKRFKNKPEDFYTGKLVCVTGKLETYKDQLQVVVTNEEQISIVEQ